MNHIVARRAYYLVCMATLLVLGSCSFVFDAFSADQLTFGGSVHEIDDALLYQWGVTDDGTVVSYGTDLVLISGNVSWDVRGGLSGTGTVLYLEMNSPGPDFDGGTYAWRSPRTMLKRASTPNATRPCAGPSAPRGRR